MQTFLLSVIVGVAICLGAIASTCIIENNILSILIFLIGFCIIASLELKLFTFSN